MEGGNPSTRKRGFSPSKPPTFPSTAWGCRPKTPLSEYKRENLLPCFFLRERDRFSSFLPTHVPNEVENISCRFRLRQRNIFSTLPLFLAGTRYIFYFAADARSEKNIKYICLPPVAAEKYILYLASVAFSLIQNISFPMSWTGIHNVP